MEIKLNLKQQLEHFDQTGEAISSDGQTWCHGFYDWFCKDHSLEAKSKKLIGQLKRFLANHPEIDTTQVYTFFKNNCPMVGPLYDDFRICDLKTGDVIYTITPKCGHSGKAEVWGSANGFTGPIKIADTYTGLFKS
jgi:hypothetical protein